MCLRCPTLWNTFSPESMILQTSIHRRVETSHGVFVVLVNHRSPITSRRSVRSIGLSWKDNKRLKRKAMTRLCLSDVDVHCTIYTLSSFLFFDFHILARHRPEWTHLGHVTSDSALSPRHHSMDFFVLFCCSNSTSTDTTRRAGAHHNHRPRTRRNRSWLQRKHEGEEIYSNKC